MGTESLRMGGAMPDQAGNLLSYDGASNRSFLDIDLNGDGASDWRVAMVGDQSGFSGIIT